MLRDRSSCYHCVRCAALSFETSLCCQSNSHTLNPIPSPTEFRGLSLLVGLLAKLTQRIYRYSLAFFSISEFTKMTRGNQRDGARAATTKKQQEAAKKTPAGEREANKGLTPEERRLRDGEALRKKQEAKKSAGDPEKK
ncbi:hypothetical protein BV898_08989 [Hypsibius exemplaris]|uniref:Small EDRK-rich factor-like N-terminal domain-containing protein n=1 Tax=Hypsibius exemplaris TaxID=2072580 RepID=A0A1W0WNL8_HYPEX|nr:hypothetical protein BV898_08989 [Hypsibius exemplaris]